MIPLLRLSLSDSDQLARIYHFANLKINQQANEIWISGFVDQEQLERVLAAISPVQSFFQDDSQRIYHRNHRVPFSCGLSSDWHPIQSFVDIQIPSAKLAGKTVSTVNITVHRAETTSGAFVEMPNTLLCKIEDLQNWVHLASEFKMNRLMFATSRDDGMTLVRGTQLPPVTGRYFCDSHGIVVPAGFELSPAIQPKVLAQWLSLRSGDIVLFDECSAPQRIAADRFAAVRRSAIRSTVKGLERDLR